MPDQTQNRPPPPRLTRKRAALYGALVVVAVGVVALPLARWLETSTDDAFYEKWGADPRHLPYDPSADARRDIEEGKARAAADGKMLMVTFGANWCPDCLTLHKNLADPATSAYAHKKFEMVNVDVGEFDKNTDVANELGVKVNGIPLAVFFSPDGKPICDTRRGELEPSRHYTSREILDFLREVAEYRRVVSPDQRQ